jgi:cysteinyl-tRNA synthetase
MVRLSNQLTEQGDVTSETLRAVDNLFSRLGGDCLGIVKDEYPESSAGDEAVIDKLVNVLIEQRNEARKQKDFAKSDAVRDKLDAIGIILEDKPHQTVWRRK